MYDQYKTLEDFPLWVLEAVSDSVIYNTGMRDLAKKYKKSRSTIYHHFNNPIILDYRRELNKTAQNHINTKMDILITESIKAYTDALNSTNMHARIKVATEVLKGKAVLVDKHDVNHSGQIIIEKDEVLD